MFKKFKENQQQITIDSADNAKNPFLGAFAKKKDMMASYENLNKKDPLVQIYMKLKCSKSKLFTNKIWASKIFPITGSGPEQVAYAISKTILDDTNMG